VFGYNENVSLPSCVGEYVKDVGQDFFGPSAPYAGAGDAATNTYAIVKFNQGLNYAATTPSKTFATSFLPFPNKSTIFNSYINGARNAISDAQPELVLAINADWSSLTSLWTEWQNATAGKCQ
jgi:hypothetical protein